MPHPLGAGGVVANRYQVGRLLSVRGLHQPTLLAQDRQTNQHVVLKELRDDLRTTPEARQEYQEELQTIGTLQVSGVPRALGLVNHEGRQYLVLEFVQGKTLRALLQKQQRLTPEQAISVMKAVLSVLNGLHNQFPPLLHMDVTPDNILLGGWDKAHLLDGAYWRQLGNPYPHRAPLYTPEYAAPEMTRGQAVPASDLFSLGVTILEAVTGVPAAGLFNPGTNRFSWEPLPYPGLQITLTRLLDGALNQRLATAAQVMQSLDNPQPLEFAQPAQPGFGAPPGFNQPQAGGFNQPQPGFPQAQPGFGQPAQAPYPQQANGFPAQQPGYGTPPGYPQQPQQGFQQPAQPGFAQPAQPGFGAPAQAGYPPQPGYPQQPVQQAPVQPAPAQPVRPPQPPTPPPPPPPPPEPPKPQLPPKREVPTELPSDIEDVSTEAGLEALMALYEAQNS